MKFGLFYWNEANNIGDDIQAYATMNLLPRIDTIIDRETPNAVNCGENEHVAVVLNGWLAYNVFNWPPSNKIYPLLLSMHFSDYLGTHYLKGLTEKYFKHYGPVGCRDDHTLNLMKQNGIDCYFSGCLTLTLPQQKKVRAEKENICISDISPKAAAYVKKVAKDNNMDVFTTTHELKNPPSQLSWEERTLNVEKLLGKYQNAKCVVTSRLHCALPCLAMGVPVLLVYDENADNRFGSFLPLLRVCTTQQFISGQCDFSLLNPPENKPDYLKIRNALKQKVAEFVNKAQNTPPEELDMLSISNEDRAYWQVEIIEKIKNDEKYKSEKLIGNYFKKAGLKKNLNVFLNTRAKLKKGFDEGTF